MSLGEICVFSTSIWVCNAPTTFQRVVLIIFSDFAHDTMEIYIDDIEIYGNNYEEVLKNLEKVPQRCQDNNLSLNHEKCFMMMEGVVLGHFISANGIQADPTKITIISDLLVPHK